MRPDPLILAFDTSAAHCAAALLCGDHVLARAAEPMTRGQAERLVPLLEEVLAAGGAAWADLDALGVCTGPGNFTGVRISVAAARGLALGLGRPAIGVTRLEALAHGVPGPCLALVDARQGRVYAQLFADGVADGAAQQTTEEALLARAPAGPAPAVTGHGAAALAAATGGRLVGGTDAPDPVALARIACARFEAARTTGAALPRPAPLYLREADAALPSEKPPAILP